MTRPIKLAAYHIGRDFGIDVDVVMGWPSSKIYEHMAFYKTESEEFRKNYAEERMTPQERADQILKILGGAL